ncbi:MAG: LysR substrate-binding domain-containing protein [Pseudomonadota bacterium]
MNLQQIRYLSKVAEQGLNLSKAALALHTSQPGISRQIRLLEEELQSELLVRQGNRISTLTESGRHAVEISRRILRELENLRKVGAEGAGEASGSLVIATTHVHARYMLIPVVKRFQESFPQIRLSLRQGTPDQIVRLVESGDADLGICTAPTMPMADLAQLPWYRIHRCVLVPKSHPLLKKKKVSLADLAAWPMINLDSSFSGGVAVMSAFSAQNIEPHIVLSATDADVIKAFVASGMGIATLPEIAFDAERDVDLRRIGAQHLFEPSASFIWVHRHRYLRRFESEFIQTLAPLWTRAKVDAAVHSAAVQAFLSPP